MSDLIEQGYTEILIEINPSNMYDGFNHVQDEHDNVNNNSDNVSPYELNIDKEYPILSISNKNVDFYCNKTIKNTKFDYNVHNFYTNILNYFSKKLNLISNIKYFDTLTLRRSIITGSFFRKIKIGNFLNKKTYPDEYCYLNQKKIIYNFEIFEIEINFTIYPITNLVELDVYKNYNTMGYMKYKIKDNEIDVIIFYLFYVEDKNHLLTSFKKFNLSMYKIINDNFTGKDILRKIVSKNIENMNMSHILKYYNNELEYKKEFDIYISNNMKKIIHNPNFEYLFTKLNVENYVDNYGNTFLHYAMFYDLYNSIVFLCENKNLFRENCLGLNPIELYFIAGNNKPNSNTFRYISRLCFYDKSYLKNLPDKVSYVIESQFKVTNTVIYNVKNEKNWEGYYNYYHIFDVNKTTKIYVNKYDDRKYHYTFLRIDLDNTLVNILKYHIDSNMTIHIEN